MSKRAGKKGREDRARRRLIEAQVKLHAAQEKRSQAVVKAEQQLERTQQHGQALVAKATERVERRAGAIAQAEAALLALTKPRARHSGAPSALVTTLPRASSDRADPPISTPVQAADLLAQREAEIAEQRSPSPIVIPEAADIDRTITPNGNESTVEHSP